MDVSGLSIQTSAADPTGSGANRDFQVIKCVVVGDTGVGKTRLICSRACGTKYSLKQLMTTHVPTVWAIDHYRKNRDKSLYDRIQYVHLAWKHSVVRAAEKHKAYLTAAQGILNRSWCTVDGMPVSLHLWDTFGYHDKDRRFAYGRADVILVCFSAVRPRSLRSVYHHWYPEIQRLCPETPIILCATQVDLRFLYQDPEFLNLDKGPFFKEIKESDILPPDRGRAVASEIRAHYYESSVLLNHGINDVFINVIRGALIHKRDKHFWNQLGGLKRISRPICQAPYQPPQPLSPKIVIEPPSLDHDLLRLLDSQSFCDVVFMVQGVALPAHKGCLVVASSVFEDFFLTLKSNDEQNEPASKATVSDSPLYTSDTTNLLDDDRGMTSPAVNQALDDTLLPFSQQFPFCVSADENGSWESVGMKSTQEDTSITIVYLIDCISVDSFRCILRYLYSEDSVVHFEKLLSMSDLNRLRKTAEVLGIQDLSFIITNILNKESFMNNAILSSVQFQRCQRRRELLLKRGYFSDIVFQAEDGSIKAHKALLMAASDVMAGMFSFNFRESAAKSIPLPGVTRESLRALQDYLYCGQCPLLSNLDCIDLIALANQMCLPRLVSLTEQYIVNELIAAEDSGKNIMEEVLLFVEPAQLHNASQLAAWCLWYVSSRYTQVYHSHAKLLQTLKPDNQVYLSKHRWPPLWYIKEADYYEKCLLEMERQRQKSRPYLRRGSEDFDSGCLSFCGRRKMKCKPPSTAFVN